MTGRQKMVWYDKKGPLDNIFRVRLSSEMKEQLQQLSAYYGLGQSEMIRYLIFRGSEVVGEDVDQLVERSDATMMVKGLQELTEAVDDSLLKLKRKITVLGNIL